MLELEHNGLSWFKRHHFLYIFGFLVFFKPIDYFYYEMLVSNKNITEQQYNELIQPISAYTSVVTSVIYFLCLTFSAYNYFVIIISVGSLVCSMAWWGGYNLVDLQVAEAFKGCVAATEIVYYASIYVCPSAPKDFGAATSYIRGIPLEAKLLSGIVSQLVVTNGWLDYQQLAFLSAPACAHAIMLVCHLPPMFEKEIPPETFRPKVSWFKDQFIETFSNSGVLKWSLWTAFTTCGYMQLSFSMQSIWRASQVENAEAAYNGAVGAVAAFLALLGVLLSGTLRAKMKHERIFLLVVSLVESALLFAYANVDSTLTCTVLYIIFDIVHHFAITIISSLIAKKVNSKGSFGIVFGFIGLVSSILNLIFACTINNNGIYLTIQGEFMVYGTYFLFITIGLSLHFYYTTIHLRRQ